MILGIDHLVILVDNLDQAIEQYKSLGFKVQPGGKHPRGTHNALVGLKDGSYLELIAFWEPEYTEHRWHHHLKTGGGLIDHALATDNLVQEMSGTGERGVPYSGPNDGARTRPDGQELVWSTAHTAASAGPALPFLIEDVTDRALRVPGGDEAEHENGIYGIESLIIAVNDLESAAAQYGTLLNSDPIQGDQATAIDQDSDAIRLQAGRHTIELQQPLGDGPMRQQIDSRGNGPYAVVFHGTEEHDFDLKMTGGARMSAIVR